MHAHRSTAPKLVAAVAAVGLIPFGIAAFGALPAADTAQTADTVQPAALGMPPYAPNWVAIETGNMPRSWLPSWIVCTPPPGIAKRIALAPPSAFAS